MKPRTDDEETRLVGELFAAIQGLPEEANKFFKPLEQSDKDYHTIIRRQHRLAEWKEYQDNNIESKKDQADTKKVKGVKKEEVDELNEKGVKKIVNCWKQLEEHVEKNNSSTVEQIIEKQAKKMQPRRKRYLEAIITTFKKKINAGKSNRESDDYKCKKNLSLLEKIMKKTVLQETIQETALQRNLQEATHQRDTINKEQPVIARSEETATDQHPKTRLKLEALLSKLELSARDFLDKEQKREAVKLVETLQSYTANYYESTRNDTETSEFKELCIDSINRARLPAKADFWQTLERLKLSIQLLMPAKLQTKQTREQAPRRLSFLSTNKAFFQTIGEIKTTINANSKQIRKR